DRHVAPTGLRILADQHACRDVAAGVPLADHGNRQDVGQVDVAGVLHVEPRCFVDDGRLDRVVQRVYDPRLYLVGADVQGDGELVAGVQQIADDGGVIAVHVLEQHRRTVLELPEHGSQL